MVTEGVNKPCNKAKQEHIITSLHLMRALVINALVIDFVVEKKQKVSKYICRKIRHMNFLLDSS